MKVFKLLAFVCILFQCSCGIYDEGPGVSLSSKRARFEGHWVFESRIPSPVYNSIYEGTENFTASKDGQIFDGFLYVSPHQSGSWEFIKGTDSIEIVLDFVGGSSMDSATTRWKINRLTGDELWMETVIYPNTVASKLVQYKFKQ